MGFNTCTLGEICDEVEGIIRTGPFGSQLHESDYQEEGVPVVMPKNIIDGKVSVEEIALIGDYDVARLSQHKLRKGDIIYGRRGDIGRRALITDRENGWLCGTGCLRISLGNSVLDPVFLYYYLGQPQVISWIYNQAIGATLPNLNMDIIRSVPISYPPLPIQHKIAAILSAYDDLIENNTRRIKILEEMAQALYREWFVKFRFPGSRKVRIVDSPIGKIPEGWKAGSLGDIAYLRKDKFSEKKHSPLPLLDLARIPRKSLAVTGFGQWNEITTSRIIFEKGDILFGSIRPYFHKVVIAPCKGVTNVSVFVIKSKSASSNLFLFNVLFSDDAIAWAIQYSSGTKMPVIKWDVFCKMEIPIPPENLLDKFNCILSPMLNAIPLIIHKNLNLRRTRDLLLPKLISGEVDVEKIDVRMPDNGSGKA